MWSYTKLQAVVSDYFSEPEIPDIEEEEEPTEQTEGEQKEAEEGEPLGEQPLTVSSPTEEEETSRKGNITISCIFCINFFLISKNRKKNIGRF